MRAPGWEDPEIAVVLAQLRAHMLSYIYASANAVSEMVQQELPAKSLDSINEMVHSLMRSFGVVLNTKAFRSEVIYDADGKEIYVHSHLYETISSLAENKAGGIWHPDELTWFLKKTKQYRTLLDTKPDTYFRRVQMWGKSIAECRAKFYSLRDVYMNEKQAASQPADAIHEARFKLLTELFEDVPPPKPDVSANQPVCKLSNLWSPDELEILLQCLVDITLDIQQHGHSDKIGQISATLKRSEQSCVTKLQAMHEKYVNKSSYHRAAHLPDCIYDPDTPIHKIFNADWSDPTDPDAVGFLAFKTFSNQILSARLRKRKERQSVAVAPTRKSSRVSPARNVSPSPSRTSATQATPEAKSSPQSINSTSDFVREISQQKSWDAKMTRHLCVAMSKHLELYQQKKASSFFVTVQKSVPQFKLMEVYFNGTALLEAFIHRFGSLRDFERIAIKNQPPSATAAEDEPAKADLPKPAQSQKVPHSPAQPTVSVGKRSRIVGKEISTDMGDVEKYQVDADCTSMTELGGSSPQTESIPEDGDDIEMMEDVSVSPMEEPTGQAQASPLFNEATTTKQESNPNQDENEMMEVDPPSNPEAPAVSLQKQSLGDNDSDMKDDQTESKGEKSATIQRGHSESTRPCGKASSSIISSESMSTMPMDEQSNQHTSDRNSEKELEAATGDCHSEVEEQDPDEDFPGDTIVDEDAIDDQSVNSNDIDSFDASPVHGVSSFSTGKRDDLPAIISKKLWAGAREATATSSVNGLTSTSEVQEDSKDCSDDNDESDESCDEDVDTDDNQHWDSLMFTLDSQITNLQHKRSELVEQKEARQKREREKRWQFGVRSESSVPMLMW